jgi:hypothetical protein
METLGNSNNPIALFHSVFLEYEIKPFLQTQERIKQEHAVKERQIVKELEVQRTHTWIQHDRKWGLLN